MILLISSTEGLEGGSLFTAGFDLVKVLGLGLDFGFNFGLFIELGFELKSDSSLLWILFGLTTLGFFTDFILSDALLDIILPRF